MFFSVTQSLCNNIPMADSTTKERLPSPASREILNDRISILADKFGVSRNTVLITMSITGPDEALVEKLLRENRFIR